MTGRRTSLFYLILFTYVLLGQLPLTQAQHGSSIQQAHGINLCQGTQKSCRCCQPPPPPSSPSPPPPPPPQPLARGGCPPDNGQQREVDGVTYKVLCHKAYSTGKYTTVNHATEESCVKACSASSTCQGANFNTDTNDCELHPEWDGQPSYTGDKTYWVAYRPVAKR